MLFRLLNKFNVIKRSLGFAAMHGVQYIAWVAAKTANGVNLFMFFVQSSSIKKRTRNVITWHIIPIQLQIPKLFILSAKYELKFSVIVSI